MKVVKMELWLIWLSGFALIGLSFYSTHRLPPLIDQITKLNSNGVSDLANPTITIFSAPRPFTGSVGDSQSLAVRSWLGLSPQIRVVLFSQHASAFSFAESFGSRVLVEPNVDFTFIGTPFFHSMMTRSYSFKSDISVLVHPEAMLFLDLISTLNYAYELDRDWLLVAALRNITHFPFHLDNHGRRWQREDGKQIQNQEEMILSQTWQQNPCKLEKLMAWNNADVPLHSVVLPPFLYGRGVHDNWVINEALSSGFRFVFDATLTISSLYQKHKSYSGVQCANDSTNENGSWEYDGNSNMGMTYGSLLYRKTNYSNLVKLFKCDGQYTFVDTEHNIFHPLGYNHARSIGRSRMLHSQRRNNGRSCLDVLKPLSRMLVCPLMDQIKTSETLDFQFSLESLLPLMADKKKTIVLAVAGYSYKDMLMSWVCRLRQLNITNFVVSALDEKTYQFSIMQGLPVFIDVSAPNNISYNDCHFGTKCFQRVTKVKSRTVLKILNLGYNVLLSDVDVYWFKNPLPFLSSSGPAVLMAQSDEYNETGPINIPRRLNSGFYFARSDGSTIAALEKVVKHAENSGMSEQPSFYDTLCGENGSQRIGDDRCVEPETNLTVQFLDRNLFPNGAYRELWQRQNVRSACAKMGCFILHNNWINGRQKKLERQVKAIRKLCRILITMMKKCAPFLSLTRDAGNDSSERKKDPKGSPYRDSESGGNPISLSLSMKSKHNFVKIVHKGRREELYPHEVSAFQLMEKYPGTSVARPEIFQNPHSSILKPEEKLLLGQKYFIMPSTAVQKLQKKQSEKLNDSSEWENVVMDLGETNFEESVFSAKEFYDPKGRPPKSLPIRGIRRKKPFVPPLPKVRTYRGPGWEPSLTSVQELSP